MINKKFKKFNYFERIFKIIKNIPFTTTYIFFKLSKALVGWKSISKLNLKNIYLKLRN